MGAKKLNFYEQKIAEAVEGLRHNGEVVLSRLLQTDQEDEVEGNRQGLREMSGDILVELTADGRRYEIQILAPVLQKFQDAELNSRFHMEMRISIFAALLEPKAALIGECIALESIQTTNNSTVVQKPKIVGIAAITEFRPPAIFGYDAEIQNLRYLKLRRTDGSYVWKREG